METADVDNVRNVAGYFMGIIRKRTKIAVVLVTEGSFNKYTFLLCFYVLV